MGREPGKKERFEVLLEQVHVEVRTIAEGHGILLKEIRETRDFLGNRITLLECAVLEQSSQTPTLTERFDTHERAHRQDRL